MNKRTGYLVIGSMALALSGCASSDKRLLSTGAGEQEYIVVLAPGVSAENLLADYALEPTDSYRRVFQGFAAHLTEAAADQLGADPRVEILEATRTDRLPPLTAASSSDKWAYRDVPWGLDRIDQRQLPLDNVYRARRAGEAHVYFFSSGVRASNVFLGLVLEGVDFIGDGLGTDDCYGAGTAEASVIAGFLGVTKAALVHPVRVVACNGAVDTKNFISGLEWVLANYQEPAVVHMSVYSNTANAALSKAVQAVLDAGIPVVVSGGNDGGSLCNAYSPHRDVPGAIYVGATDRNDRKAANSSYGACIDLFAPGVDIPVASWQDDYSFTFLGETSLAAAHVTGIVAQLLGSQPNQTPEQVEAALIDKATEGVVVNPGSNSPNLLAYSWFHVLGGF